MYHLVKVEKKQRFVVQTVDDIDDVITIIENQYPEQCNYLEDVHHDDFLNEVNNGNKYESGLYIVELPDCINVYRVCTKIYYGYLFNSAQRESKLVDRYELVLNKE